ncbi:hypothetical protein [Pacificoceanicola onchidii]|uniref:hypothetical protein n=1 Tax=Pacificoceanicola onchidii TaxID=2562685 RepID=UPI0010A62A97|nr:hypothetical protein [Pacificoceanicola onchidii]
MIDPLRALARHGQWVLTFGLALGLGLPGLADTLHPWLSWLVVGLLYVSFLRLSVAGMLEALRALPDVMPQVLILQLALPLLVTLIAWITGTLTSPVALALILVSAAPAIVGSPNVVVIMGASPEPALRLMVAGTLLLPLTIIPVFVLSPVLSGVWEVVLAALRLLLTIVLTALAAMLTRRLLFPNPGPVALDRLQGASALALVGVVIALMPAVAEVARTSLSALAFWLAIAFATNFGAQCVGQVLTKRAPRDEGLALSFIAGNRNIALFLVSLPPEATTQILPFIGCYQLPMYLTPLLLRRLYS